ncbi:MAG: cytochrome c-type biogenesis protein, partial [Nitrospirales bacterium]
MARDVMISGRARNCLRVRRSPDASNLLSHGSLTFMLLFLIILLHLLVPSSALMAQPADLEEQARIIASDLRCPVCQNLSVADSPSELARQMRDLIREQLREGKSPEEIKAYFVSKYGEWV